METLVTIILGTNRPQNIKDFIEDLESKSTNPEQVEVIFSVDKGDNSCIDILKEQQLTSKVKIKYLESVRSRGYFEANIQYNECLHLSDEKSQFFAIFSDKLKIATRGWDEKLKNYSNYFEDGLFRVRTSCFKNFRYNGDLFDAISKPDNFAFHSRKFIELCGGWGDFWGPDSWAQGVLFFCELLKINDRDIVASDIELEKYFYSDSSSVTKSSIIRSKMINWSFNFLSSSKIALDNFFRIACKISLYIENYKTISCINYKFVYEVDKVILVDKIGVVIAEKSLASNDCFEASVYLLKSRIGSVIKARLGKIYHRINRYKKAKAGIKKAILFLNLRIAKVKLFLEIFCQSAAVSFSVIKKSGRNQEKYESIVQVSNSAQFFIEQNSSIEKSIREQYYRVIGKNN